MANAAVGEPLALRSAVTKWAAQSAFGTASTLTTSLGIGLAGFNKNSNNARFRGPGSPNVVAKKGGSVYTDWNVKFPAAQTGIKALLLKAVRASGVLPYISLGIGYEDDESTSNKSVERIRDSVITGLNLSYDCFNDHAPLVADLTGFGTVVDTITNLTKATLTTKPWMSYEAAVLMEGAAYVLPKLDLSVAHTVSRDYVAPGSTPASNPRAPNYITCHDEVITGSISRFQALGHNVLANTVGDKDIGIIWTSLDDSVVLTLVLTDCDFANERHEETEQGLRWSADFEANSWGLS